MGMMWGCFQQKKGCHPYVWTGVPTSLNLDSIAPVGMVSDCGSTLKCVLQRVTQMGRSQGGVASKTSLQPRGRPEKRVQMTS